MAEITPAEQAAADHQQHLLDTSVSQIQLVKNTQSRANLLKAVPPTPRSRVVYGLAAIACVVIGLGTGLFVANNRAAAPAPTLPSWGGTYSLIQTTSVAGLNATVASLSTPGLKGLSVRVPGTALDPSLSIFTAAAALAKAHHIGLAIRPMAGTSTPAADLGNSVKFAGGGLIPLSWGPTATPTSYQPNVPFETWYTALCAQLATFAVANGVLEVHLPWYGAQWAELYEGPEVVAAKGFSYANWLTGHERLIDIAAHALLGKGFMVEFPLTGLGPDVDGGPADNAIVKYIAGKYGQGIAVQSNNLTATSRVGKWSIPHGLQMYGVGDYDWTAVYNTVKTSGALSLEIYYNSFAPNLAHHSVLLAQVAAF
jgi:hypothetical protein